MSPLDPIIGIDLGTTHSVVAAVVEGHAKVIPSRTGHSLTPSVVAISPSGARLVGQVARRQAITNPAQTVFASKRFLGRVYSHPQVQEDLKNIAYEVVKGPQDDVRARMGEQDLSMQEIAAMLLVELKLDAEAFFGKNVTRAVITVPAYFTHAQRQATKEAAQIAGLEVLRIVNEPTAAALAYGFGKTVQGKIAVFDLGGGTFDVSVLDVHNEVFEVVGTGGDSHLGGEDFDKAIVDFLLAEFLTQHNVDLRKDRVALQRVKDAAEAAKIELSTVTQTKIQLPFIHRPAGAGNPLHLDANLTRQKLEELTDDLCQKTVQITEQALKEAKAQNVKEIILVGGMTRMPRIVQVVKNHFSKEPCKGVHPDEVVALGAAILGHSLAASTDDSKALLLDVTPQSLGIVVAGGFVHQLIPRGTTVPVATSQVFNTSKDNQKVVTITVTQGESRVAHENSPLGEFQLTGLRNGLRGEVKIEVTFDIDAGGLVSVTAKDLTSGQSHQIMVTTHSGLSPEEISTSSRQQMEYMKEHRTEREKRALTTAQVS